jgi:hypothetical protein
MYPKWMLSMAAKFLEEGKLLIFASFRESEIKQLMNCNNQLASITLIRRSPFLYNSILVLNIPSWPDLLKKVWKYPFNWKQLKFKNTHMKWCLDYKALLELQTWKTFAIILNVYRYRCITISI